MDDAGPQRAADAAEIRDVVQQRIHERVARVTGRGVDNHARRLVDHDQVRILVNDDQRQGLWLRCGCLRRGYFQRHDVAAAHRGAGAARLRADARPPIADQSLQLRAGAAGQARREQAIEAHGRVAAVDGKPDQLPAGGYAARVGMRPVGSGLHERCSLNSMKMPSGMSSTETNCEVESTSNAVPRGSPR